MTHHANVIVTTPEPSSTTSHQAEKLAQQTGLPFSNTHDIEDQDLVENYDFVLQVITDPEHDYRILLKDLHSKASPIDVDFSEGYLAHRRQFGGGRRQPLARAVGIKPGRTLSVIDATAGLARDAFVLACLGCKVTMVERSAVLASLVSDAIRRASTDPTLEAMMKDMFEINIGNSIEFITRHSQTHDRPEIDVIYMDPMYPHRQKSALVKKEMRIIRQLVGDDDDSSELLECARTHARARVVVKRPRIAPPVGQQKPSLSIESKNTRYDIYLCN